MAKGKAELDDVFPPRGSGVDGRRETPPAATWAHPSQLSPAWDWAPGKIVLGTWGERLIGHGDDRHVVTIAGSRAGKSSTVLIPNLIRYPGSCLIIDPKGELARATAEARAKAGHGVIILDPFHITGWKSHSHNPLHELGQGRADHIAPDAALLADALVINAGGETHWTDGAKDLIKGLVLFRIATDPHHASLRQLRRDLNADPATLAGIFDAMTKSPAFDALLAQVGASFLAKLEQSPRELQGILSTAQIQTAPLDDVRGITDTSDFRLGELKARPLTIYLILPGMRLGTHYRWLRLLLQLALAAMERTPMARDMPPVLFVLEEFSALGHVRAIETAAGLMAGFGVKLWAVIQDLSQLKTHYRNSWETFLGNAGVLQAFGNVDQTTTEYLSRALGATQVVEVQDVRVSGNAMQHGDLGRREHVRNVRLLDPNEIAMHFARETNRQLILTPGRPPIYLNRLAPLPREEAHANAHTARAS